MMAANVETVEEWAVVDTGLPMDFPPLGDELAMYCAESEADARSVLEQRIQAGARAWLERRTVTYGEWERVA